MLFAATAGAVMGRVDEVIMPETVCELAIQTPLCLGDASMAYIMVTQSL